MPARHTRCFHLPGCDKNLYGTQPAQQGDKLLLCYGLLLIYHVLLPFIIQAFRIFQHAGQRADMSHSVAIGSIYGLDDMHKLVAQVECTIRVERCKRLKNTKSSLTIWI